MLSLGKVRMFFIIFLVVIFPHLNPILALAQEDFVVVVGKSKTFTEFNYYDSWFEKGCDNCGTTPSPPESDREAYAGGNTARVGLRATPGHAAAARALTGVQFSWDLGPYTWEQVQDWPVNIAIDAEYTLEADWVDGNGSANAGINLSFMNGPFYAFIGYAVGNPHPKSETIRQVFTTTSDGHLLTIGELETFGRKIFLEAYCQAHSINESGTIHHSSALISINSITIDFNNAIINPAIINDRANGQPTPHRAVKLDVATAKYIQRTFRNHRSVVEAKYLITKSIRAFEASLINYSPNLYYLAAHGVYDTSNNNLGCIIKIPNLTHSKSISSRDIDAIKFKVNGGLFFANVCESAHETDDRLGMSFINHGYTAYIGFKKQIVVFRAGVFARIFFDKATTPNISVARAFRETMDHISNWNDPSWDDVLSAKLIPQDAGEDLFLGGRTD